MRTKKGIESIIDYKFKKYPEYGTVSRIDGNLVDVSIPSSASDFRHLKVLGDVDLLHVGDTVHLKWVYTDKSSGKIPVVEPLLSERDIFSEVSLVPDNSVIEASSAGLTIKVGGIRPEHLGFEIPMGGGILSEGGWSITSDNVIYAENTYIHPDGQIFLGTGDNSISLDSQHATYRLWAGDIDPATAPFSVTKAGAISATSGTIAGWTISSTGFTSSDSKAKLMAGTYPYISLGDATGFMSNEGFWAGKDETDSIYKLRIGDPTTNYMFWDGTTLHVEGSFTGNTYVAENVIATIGGRILVATSTMLTSDAGAGDGTIYVRHNNLSSGDRVYLENGGNVEFMAITSAAGGAGPYSYTVTRDLDGSGANAWYIGDAVVSTGQSGDGFIDIYAVSGVGNETGPTIVGNIRNSATYNDWTEYWAIGNLNGLYGYVADTFGAAFGKYGDEHIVIDTGSGIRFRDASNNVVTQINAGSVTIGNTSSGNYLSYSVADGLELYVAPSEISIDKDGLQIGINTKLVFDQYEPTWMHTDFDGTDYFFNIVMGRWDTELITNTGFETDTTGWTLSPKSGDTLERNTSAKRTGSYGIYGITSWSIDPNSTLVTSLISGITAGATYYASIWGYLNSSSTYAQFEMFLRIDWYTSGDAYISSTSWTWLDTGKTDAWQQLNISGTAPATTAKARLKIEFDSQIYGTGFAYFYVDDASLKRVYNKKYIRWGDDVFDVVGDQAVNAGKFEVPASGAGDTYNYQFQVLDVTNIIGRIYGYYSVAGSTFNVLAGTDQNSAGADLYLGAKVSSTNRVILEPGSASYVDVIGSSGEMRLTGDIKPKSSTYGLNTRFEYLFGDDKPANNHAYTQRQFSVNNFTGHVAGFEDSQSHPYSFGGSPGGFSLTYQTGHTVNSTGAPHHLFMSQAATTGAFYVEWTDATGKNMLDTVFGLRVNTGNVDQVIFEARVWEVQTPGASDEYWAFRIVYLGSSAPATPIKCGFYRGTGTTISTTDGTLLTVLTGIPYMQMYRLKMYVVETDTCYLDFLGAESPEANWVYSAQVTNYPGIIKTARIYAPGNDSQASYSGLLIDEVRLY